MSKGTCDIVFAFDAKSLNDLSDLQHDFRVSSYGEAIRHSMTIAQFITEAVRQGHTVILRKGSSEQEVVIPVLAKLDT